MRRFLIAIALATSSLVTTGAADALRAGGLCAVGGCTGTVNVCFRTPCSGTVSVCPGTHPRDCHSTVDVCLELVGPRGH